MCRFSIIVPLLGDQERFDDTLASVLRYRPIESQIIVVHDGEYDDPYELEGEIKIVQSDKSDLISQLNIGICYVAGEITVLVRPGVELDENWGDSVDSAFADKQIACVSPLMIKRSRPSRIVSLGVARDRTWSRHLVGNGKKVSNRILEKATVSGPSSWLAAYRTSVLKTLAPLDEELENNFVDLDIALSIESLRLTNQLCPDFVGLVDSEQDILNEALRPHGKSARRAEQRFCGMRSVLHCLQNILLDIGQSPFRTWKFKHALQRLTAGRYSKIDREFAVELKKMALKRSWEVEAPDVVSFDSRDSYRRAA